MPLAPDTNRPNALADEVRSEMRADTKSTAGTEYGRIGLVIYETARQIWPEAERFAVLTLHDGAAGNRRQALALADALRLSAHEVTLHPNPLARQPLVQTVARTWRAQHPN